MVYIKGMKTHSTWQCTALLLFVVIALPARSAEPHFELSTLEWPPYIGSSIKNDGYVAQLVTRAFELGGGNVHYTFLPWARALLSVKKGTSVGVFPEYYDSSRESEMVFSDPFPGGPVGLLHLQELPLEFTIDPRLDIEGALQGLAKYRFGVVRGYLNTPEFDQARYLEKIQSSSDTNNLMMLLKGRVDIVFIDELVAQDIIQSSIPELQGKVEMMHPVLAYKPLYVAFSRQHPDHKQALIIFNRGLAVLKQSGELDALLVEFGIPESHGHTE